MNSFSFKLLVFLSFLMLAMYGTLAFFCFRDGNMPRGADMCVSGGIWAFAAYLCVEAAAKREEDSDGE